MSDPVTIRNAVERDVRAITLRASVGQGTAVTRAKLADGLSCEISDGNWKFTAGMGSYGGSHAGATPGVYGRAALASGLAIGYAIWAARLEIQIDSLEVEVQADFDARGELGVDDAIPPGYLAVRYIINISSPAPESEVMRLVETAEKYSSW